VHERATSHVTTREDLNELFRRCEEQRVWSRELCAQTKELRLQSETARGDRAKDRGTSRGISNAGQ
jgi:hypothetical protein